MFWWLLMACTTPLPPGGEVEALTYNVAGLPGEISGSDPERNMPVIADKLNGYELALVQEDFAYHADLAAGTDHPYRSVPAEPEQTPVADGLNRFSDHPLGPVERQQWVDCHGVLEGASDCLAEKGFSVSEVWLTPEVSLLVYNHHGEAGGGPEDIAAREAGFAQMAAHVQDTAGDRAVLLGGDTNLHGFDPDDEPILQDFLDATGMKDACRALDCGDEHIDRFLFRSGADLVLEPVDWAVATEFVDAEGAPLSDHPAIRARFAWAVTSE